jgi:hypothetical protein
MYLLTKSNDGISMEVLNEIQSYVQFDNLKDVSFLLFVEEELRRKGDLLDKWRKT